MAWLGYASLLVLISISATSDHFISRPEYGVTFTELKQNFVNGLRHLEYTFSVPKPDIKLVPAPINISATLEGKDSLKSHAKNLTDNTFVEYKEVKKLIKQIHSFLNSRFKQSAPLGFVEKALEPIFGFASFDDVQMLQHHVSRIEVEEKHIVVALKGLYESYLGLLDTHDEFLVYYSARENQTAHNIWKNRQVSKNITRNLLKFARQVNVADNNLMQMHLGSAQYTNLINIAAFCRDVLVLLDSLHSGILPRRLIQPSDMRKAILNVEKELRSTSVGRKYKVKDNCLEEIYREPIRYYSIGSKSIDIRVSIPLVRRDEIYTVYRINTMWSPAHTVNKDLYSRVRVERYIGISKDQSRYIVADRLIDPHGEEFDTVPSRSYFGESCAMGLMKDNHTVVEKFCRFDLSNKVLPPSALRLHNNKVLYRTANHKPLLVCQNKRGEQLTVHSLSVITIPCECRVIEGDFEVKSSTSCVHFNASHSLKIDPILNVPVLAHFSEIPYSHIVQFKDLNWDLHKLDQKAALHTQKINTSRQKVHDLKQFANRMLKEVTSNTSGSSWSDQLQTMVRSDASTYVTYVLLGLLILSNVYTILSIKSIKLTLLALSIKVNNAKAGHIPQGNTEDLLALYNKHANPTSAPTTPADTESSMHEMYWLVMVGLSTTSVLLFVWLIVLRLNEINANRNRMPYLGFKIHYGWITIVERLVPFPHELNTVRLRRTGPLCIIRRIDKCRGYIHVEWSANFIFKTNMNEEIEVELPNAISLSWRNWLKVISMDHFHYNLFLEDSNGKHVGILMDE